MKLVTISKELQLATRMSEQEIRRELAVHLYAQGKLSAGKARELAGMTVTEFQCLLGSRGIAVNYGVEDFRDDLDTIARLKLDQ
jgi:predicted HTH domain antitoxin